MIEGVAMSGSWKLVIGGAALVCLIYLTNNIKHEQIESELLAKSQAVLAANAMGWARVVRIEGRNAVLAGQPPSQDAAQAALDSVEDVFGVHSARGDFNVLEAVSPFLWIAESGETSVTLSGVVPSQEIRSGLLTAAQAAFPDKTVTDEMRIAAGVPGGDWTGATTFAIAQLATLQSGQAKLLNTTLTIAGRTPSQRAAESLQASAKTLTAGYRLSTDVLVNVPEVNPAPLATPNQQPDVPESVIVPQEAQIEIDRCQTRIDDIMTGQTIEFRTSSAEVFPQPNPLLTALGGVAKECPQTRIAISGHTDTVGDAQANQRLSLARAQAIVNLLVDDGVPESRLSAEGFGADRPIADNTTPEGRSTNRRIEFRVLYAGTP